MNGRCENERHAGSTDGGIRIFQNRKEVLDVCVADEKLDYSEEADAVEGFNKSAEVDRMPVSGPELPRTATLTTVTGDWAVTSGLLIFLCAWPFAIVQHDHQNVDKSLIALFELKNVLTEGTFFSAQVTMHTYIFYGNGIPSKVYHLYVDKLRVLDKGYGAAWQIHIPSFPVAGPSGLSTPSPKKRKERDDTADDAFEAFDAVSPKKKF
ncbi:hypothetical protein B0H10DRAFT_1963614 [Mycena sp. CBHHK59/15]|nr:hypothetical protein B0H10DRAFT_1963614 [Mycena sp. CBHHK59/15]